MHLALSRYPVNLLVKYSITIFLLTLASTNVHANGGGWAAQLAEECYNCTQAAIDLRADRHAETLNRNAEYYALDRANSQLYKYYIIIDPFGTGHLDSTDVDEIKNAFVKDVKVIDQRQTTNRIFDLPAVVYQISPTVQELDAFLDFKELVEVFYNISGPSPIGTVATSDTFEVPDGAIPNISSGFDLLTNQDELNVGLWIMNNHTRSAFVGTSIEKITRAFGRIAISFEYDVVIHFADGSSGIWKINNRDEFDLVPGTLRDSDNNVIASTTSEIPSAFSFGAGPDGDNAVRQMERLLQIRFGIGGGSCTPEPRWECDSRSRCSLKLVGCG